MEAAAGWQSFIKTKQQARLGKWGHTGLTFGVWPRSTNIISDADSLAGPLYWKKEGQCEFQAYVGADSLTRGTEVPQSSVMCYCTEAGPAGPSLGRGWT